MSYILNALQKSEHERAGDAGGQTKTNVSHALHTPVPAPRKRPIWALMLAGGASTIAMIAVAVWTAGPWSGPPRYAKDASSELAAAATAISTPPTESPPQDNVASTVPHNERVQPSAEVAPEPEPVAETLASQERVDEPNAGGRMPVQRTPRPVPDAPETSAPLVALLLDPPVPAPGANQYAEPSAKPRPIVTVNQIPPPPVASPNVSASANSVDTDTFAVGSPMQTRTKTVTIAPNTADPDPRRDMAAVDPPPADRVAHSQAVDFHEKGWAFERSGDFSGALDAFSRALELRPDFADAYFGRAWIRDRLDQLEQATTDYSHAIRIEPQFAAAYGSRGVARFYLNELAEAEMDFEQTLQLGRGELRRFAALWRYLSAEHDGRNGAAQLAADTQDIDLGRWPGVIAQFYLGTADSDTVLRNARDPDAVVARERLCVAYFFIAHKDLLDGNATQARDNFQKALDTGVTEFIQFKAAQRELSRLASLR